MTHPCCCFYCIPPSNQSVGGILFSAVFTPHYTFHRQSSQNQQSQQFWVSQPIISSHLFLTFSTNFSFLSSFPRSANLSLFKTTHLFQASLWWRCQMPKVCQLHCDVWWSVHITSTISSSMPIKYLIRAKCSSVKMVLYLCHLLLILI